MSSDVTTEKQRNSRSDIISENTKFVGKRKFSKKRGKRSFKQPNSVVIKHKVPCTITEFIGAPLRDVLPQVCAISVYPSVSDNGICAVNDSAKGYFNNILSRYTHFRSVDLCNSIFAYDEKAVADPWFIGWNPYLDAELLGGLWDRYKDMYDYWRYGGVKVKWIPYVRTAGVVPRQMTSLSISVPEQAVVGNTGAVTNGGVTYQHYEGTNAALTATGTPSYRGVSSVDSGAQVYDQQVTLNMHVLFEKDNYDCFELPTNPAGMTEDEQCKDTRFKYRTFERGPDKPNTYKIYNMTKPFSFFVKPYMQTSVSENGANDGQTGVAVTDINDQITKRKTMPFLKFQGTYSDKVTASATNLVQYQQRIQDKNYFDPVLFSYFFTVNGISVNTILNEITPTVPTGKVWNQYGLHSSPMLSSMGRFELTFYTHFKQLKTNQ